MLTPEESKRLDELSKGEITKEAADLFNKLLTSLPKTPLPPPTSSSTSTGGRRDKSTASRK